MNRLIHSNSDSTSNTSVAVSAREFAYGTAVGVGHATGWKERESWTLADSIRFYFGEYFSGILFISAIFCFTFFLPATLTKPGKQVTDMIDKFLKKILDVLGGFLGLIIAIPIFLIVPIVIKLNSNGAIFYTQDRVGINRRKRNRRAYNADLTEDNRRRERRKEDLCGKPFKVIKFRTMVKNAEKSSGPVWATQNDCRITRVGKILRKTRVDEVPQLLNVLMGDMSLVGPRPERPFFVKDLSQKVPGYKIRLRVRPGITGLAQVNNGYDSSLESVKSKVHSDITYIRTWTIWSDIKILMKTVVVVITGKGAC